MVKQSLNKNRPECECYVTLKNQMHRNKIIQSRATKYLQKHIIILNDTNICSTIALSKYIETKFTMK